MDSVKGYADDATLISTSEEIHIKILSEVDSKAREIGLLLMCISIIIYDGSKFYLMASPSWEVQLSQL